MRGRRGEAKEETGRAEKEREGREGERREDRDWGGGDTGAG